MTQQLAASSIDTPSSTSTGVDSGIQDDNKAAPNKTTDSELATMSSEGESDGNINSNGPPSGNNLQPLEEEEQQEQQQVREPPRAA